MGTKERNIAKKAEKVKAENKTPQQKDYSPKGIYQKLECIEKKVDSSNRTQKRIGLCALGAAFVILGLSLWPGFLELIGIGTGGFYRNSVSFIFLGFITMFLAFIVTRQRKEKSDKDKN